MTYVPLGDLPNWENIERMFARARAEPEHWGMYMESDYGGVWLLSCPMTLVRVSARSVVTLLLDLSDLDGLGPTDTEEAPGDDCQLALMHYPDGNRCITDLRMGVMEHDAALREQVLRVLGGEQERLDLSVYPWDEPPASDCLVETLDEARARSDAAVVAGRIRGRSTVFEAPVALVRVPLERVAALVAEVVGLREHPEPRWAPRDPIETEVQVRLRPSSGAHPDDDVRFKWGWDWLDDENTRARVRAVLSGERDHL